MRCRSRGVGAKGENEPTMEPPVATRRVRTEAAGRSLDAREQETPRGRTGDDAALTDILARDERHSILLASGYNKPRSEPGPKQSNQCDMRAIWMPWGWAVDRKRLTWLIVNRCFRNRKCFTCQFRSQ